MGCFQYFAHEIDSDTLFCQGCGRFLADLQENLKWEGKEVMPACHQFSNVVAISHLVRNPERNALQDRTPPVFSFPQ